MKYFKNALFLIFGTSYISSMAEDNAPPARDFPSFYLASGEQAEIMRENLPLEQLKLIFETKDKRENRIPFEVRCRRDLSDLPCIDPEDPESLMLRQNIIISTDKRAMLWYASFIKRTDGNYDLIFVDRFSNQFLSLNQEIEKFEEDYNNLSLDSMNSKDPHKATVELLNKTKKTFDIVLELLQMLQGHLVNIYVNLEDYQEKVDTYKKHTNSLKYSLPVAHYYHDCCLQPTEFYSFEKLGYGLASMMFWSSIKFNYSGKLYFMDRYLSGSSYSLTIFGNCDYKNYHFNVYRGIECIKINEKIEIDDKCLKNIKLEITKTGELEFSLRIIDNRGSST